MFDRKQTSIWVHLDQLCIEVWLFYFWLILLNECEKTFIFIELQIAIYTIIKSFRNSTKNNLRKWCVCAFTIKSQSVNFFGQCYLPLFSLSAVWLFSEPAYRQQFSRLCFLNFYFNHFFCC